MSLSARRLAQAIWAKFGDFPGLVGVEHLSRRDWASATFTGARHGLRITLAGPEADAAADRFIAGLDHHDFDLRGHFVASIALAGDRRGNDAVELSVELLVIAAEQGADPGHPATL